MGDLWWWAYLHSNGTVQVKRYHGDEYEVDCIESPYVITYIQPFKADNREQAIEVATNKLKGE